MVKVYRNLFGTGCLVQPEELTLGPGASESLRQALPFHMGLHEFSSKLQFRGNKVRWALGLEAKKSHPG